MIHTPALSSRRLIGACVIALCTAQPLLSQARSLFNGVDLSGWRVDVPAIDTTPSLVSPFQVRNGVLAIAGTPEGHLISDASFRNYRLELEYRFTGAPGTAGAARRGWRR